MKFPHVLFSFFIPILIHYNQCSAFLNTPIKNNLNTKQYTKPNPCRPAKQTQFQRNLTLQSTKNKADPLGLKRGSVVLVIAVIYNIWLFSIPPEYRRAKTCSAEQVQAKLNCHCITNEDWWSGVKEYYRDGGGVHFDLSIESDASKECRDEFSF